MRGLTRAIAAGLLLGVLLPQGRAQAIFTCVDAKGHRLTADRPIHPSLEAMRWARETCSQLMDRMSDEDWRIVGTHSESGRYGTEDWLRIYAGHAHEHAAQIKRARGKS